MNDIKKAANPFAIFVICIALSALMTGCVSLKEGVKIFEGTSTKDVEDARKNASVKVFNYGYDICYAKTEKLLQNLTSASIYAKTKDMIAIYYIDPDTTPVGVFFKAVDAAHTQVEVSSPSSPTKEYVAKVIFSGTAPKAAGSSIIKIRKPSAYSHGVMK